MRPPRRILLIEADPVLRGWMGRVLRDDAFEVSVAVSVQLALPYFKDQTAFAAVVCNQYLPDGTWLDLLGELRHLPLLLLRRANGPPPEALVRVGFETLIPPFTGPELLAKLAGLLPPTNPGDTVFLYRDGLNR